MKAGGKGKSTEGGGGGTGGSGRAILEKEGRRQQGALDLGEAKDQAPTAAW